MFYCTGLKESTAQNYDCRRQCKCSLLDDLQAEMSVERHLSENCAAA
jgi:hypothetical protein